jgi:hypothetical protein
MPLADRSRSFYFGPEAIRLSVADVPLHHFILPIAMISRFLMLECLRKNQEKLSPRCVARANNVVRNCDRDAAQLCQNVVAGQGNILGCLTTAKGSVSRRCNAALDAAFLRR